MPVAFGFVSFLFYRIATAAMLDEPLSIIACVLAAIISTAIMFAFSMVCAASLGRLAFRRTMEGSQQSKFEIITIPLLIGLAANCVQMYLIALGFSERFFREISRGGYSYSRAPFYEENWFVFLVITSVPILLHGAVFVALMKIAPIQRVPTKDTWKSWNDPPE